MEEPTKIDRRRSGGVHIVETVNINQVIHKGPCVVSGAFITSIGAAGTVLIYDGDNALTPIKIPIASIDGTTFGSCFPNNIKFTKGIYVVVNAATTYATIAYKPLNPADCFK